MFMKIYIRYTFVYKIMLFNLINQIYQHEAPLKGFLLKKFIARCKNLQNSSIVPTHSSPKKQAQNKIQNKNSKSKAVSNNHFNKLKNKQ